MQQETLSLSPRVLLFYVGHSLRVMTGKASMDDVYQTDGKGLWHAIWASMIFTAMVTIYPTLKNAPSIFVTTMIVQLVGLVLVSASGSPSNWLGTDVDRAGWPCVVGRDAL